jgi:hypothetical protein
MSSEDIYDDVLAVLVPSTLLNGLANNGSTIGSKHNITIINPDALVLPTLLQRNHNYLAVTTSTHHPVDTAAM